MTEIKRWSTSAAGNTMAVPDGAPEGWAPSSVNNVYREGMAGIRRWQRDLSGEITATFSAQTYSMASEEPLTANELAGIYSFVADAANTGTALLSINSLTAAPIKHQGQHLRANEIAAKQVVSVAYNKSGATFQMVGPPSREALGFADTGFYVTLSANDSTNTGDVYNKIGFDTETYDNGSLYNSSTKRLVPGAVSTWFLHASVSLLRPLGAD